jgi:hypothetical protein
MTGNLSQALQGHHGMTVSNGGKNNHSEQIKYDKNPFFRKQSAVDTDGWIKKIQRSCQF